MALTATFASTSSVSEQFRIKEQAASTTSPS
jgi:hypothetical protein